MQMDSPIVFFGFCERFSQPVIGQLKSGNSGAPLIPLSKQNIIGLKNHNILSIYPFPLRGWHALFLIDQAWLIEKQANGEIKWKIIIENSQGENCGDIDVQISVLYAKQVDIRFFIVPVALGDITFKEPGDYKFYLLNGNNKNLIGTTYFFYSPALPLTEDRIKAIESDPLAYKKVRMEQRCKICNGVLKISLGLKKDDTQTEYTWYQDLPDTFRCDCGKLSQNLKYIKESGHVLLGQRDTPFTDSELTERNYTYGALEEKARQFKELIEKEKVPEEDVQKFLDNNTIIFNIFSPLLIQGKSPINSVYKTDFVILNQKRELLLIEIERPGIPLFRKNGDITAELTHAFGQVESWLSRAKRNKLAIIDDLGLKGITIDDVIDIKGIVIAGRSRESDRTHRERMAHRHGIEFYTYDDLFAHLRKLIEEIKTI